MMNQTSIPEDKVRMLSSPAPNRDFEDIYLRVRSCEERIYPLSVIKQLPDVPKGHPHHREWEIRKKGLDRFLKYLKASGVRSLLEVGCGNGWLSAAIARANPAMEVVGADLNLFELKQAAGAFQLDNLRFVFGDISEEWPAGYNDFDLLLLASSAQYFRNLPALVANLKKHAGKKAEVHFIDTHFYEKHEMREAVHRSTDYYRQLGHADMAAHYFHHSLDQLEALGGEILYRPPKGLRRWIYPKASPFYWSKIKV